MKEEMNDSRLLTASAFFISAAVAVLVAWCSSCGGGQCEREKNVCDQANEIVYTALNRFCASHSCCYCECFDAGMDVDINRYKPGECFCGMSTSPPYDPYNCVVDTGSAEHCVSDSDWCDRKWTEHAQMMCDEYY